MLLDSRHGGFPHIVGGGDLLGKVPLCGKTITGNYPKIWWVFDFVSLHWKKGLPPKATFEISKRLFSFALGVYMGSFYMGKIRVHFCLCEKLHIWEKRREKAYFSSYDQHDQLDNKRSICGPIELIFGQQHGDLGFLILYGWNRHLSLVAARILVLQ